jgi:hypothetical protein
MATYVNNLRLKEITTGDEDGTWGTSTNTNLELIGEALGYNTQDCFATDANATTTVADGATDPARAFYFKVTSSATLTATRTLTIAPNTVSRVMFIENATTGSQSIEISQGSGANVTIPTGEAKVVYLDGAGATAAVVDALNLVDIGDGTVTSVGGTGTVNGITLTGTVTSSGNLTLGGTLANVDLTSQVTGTLPVANGGTGITSFGTGVGTALGNNVNAAGGVVTTDGTATLTSKTLTDPAIIGTILEDVYTISDGAAFEVDPGNGSIQLITLGASRTPKATNFAAGESVTLMVDDGTAYTLTWTDATWGTSGVIWFTDGGSAPTLNTSGYTSIALWKVGSQVYGARVGDA